MYNIYYNNNMIFLAFAYPYRFLCRPSVYVLVYRPAYVCACACA